MVSERAAVVCHLRRCLVRSLLAVLVIDPAAIWHIELLTRPTV
jgi:hypothetical protein